MYMYHDIDWFMISAFNLMNAGDNSTPVFCVHENDDDRKHRFQNYTALYKLYLKYLLCSLFWGEMFKLMG